MPLPDKQEFLEKLRQALIERDISETDITPYIERFDRFFERMTQDAENDRSDLLSDIDRIADNIADQISERYDEINRLAERTLTVDRVKPDEDAELAVAEDADNGSIDTTDSDTAAISFTVDDAPDGDVTRSFSSETVETASETGTPEDSDGQLNLANPDAVPQDKPSRKFRLDKKPQSNQAAMPNMAEGQAAPRADMTSRSDISRSDMSPNPDVMSKPDIIKKADSASQLINASQMKREPAKSSEVPGYIDEEPAPNSTIFWVLFAVSLPLTIPLALLVLLLFLGVWGGLAALIVGSIGVLIVGVAGGTALSLVGIIYGTTQLFSELPVGLYEIGLGVLIGGIVMFCGILLYNFAIRLLPLLMKLVARLFRYLYKQFWVLFKFLRKECAKL